MRAMLLALMRLFPPDFRERFGPEMAEQLERDRRAARARGRLRGAAWGVATAADLVGAAVAERIRPAWERPGTDTTTGEGRMAAATSGWMGDLRHAVRALKRAPGFTAVTVATLGLAIGANAGIFSVVDAVLLDPLPFQEADRLVTVAGTAPGSDLPAEFGLGAEFYVQYAERSETLEGIAPYSLFTSTLREGDRAERVWMSAGTTNLLELVGARPILGRLPTTDEEGAVVVISHRLWSTWFASDPDIVGRTIDAAGASLTVVGVTGPDFWFPTDQALLWIGYRQSPTDITPGRFGQAMVARMAPGADEAAAAAELTRLARDIPARFGGTPYYARVIEQYRAIVRPFGESVLGAVTRPLWVLLASVGIVLLIACANVANLFTVRAERRQGDLAVRRAMGAARRQLVRTQMAEAVVVAGLAGVVAVALAWVSVPLFVAAAPPDVPRLADAGITGTTLLFTAGASVLAALLCGLVPALRGSRPSLRRLRDGMRGSTQRRHWGRDGLVVAQTALALVLLIGAGLLVRSFQALRDVDPGYDVEDVFTFQIAPEADHLDDGPSFAAFHEDFMDRLRALPGVQSVGIVENVPLNEGLAGGRFYAEGTESDPEGGSLVRFTFAGGDYFRTMGIDVLQGRALADGDHVTGQPSRVVVSASAARLLWPGEDPVGRRLMRQDTEDWLTVVGVVEDVMQYGFRDVPDPLLYYPMVGPTPSSWGLSSPAYVVKTPRADALAPEVRELVREVAPGAPMYRVFTMEGLAADSMVQLSFTMLTLGVASALALLLGSIGLYGVLSYVVAERTREIGVRMALGAEAAGVQRMVVAQGARVVIVGVAVGAVAALACTRVLAGLLFGVEAVDVTTFLAMSLTMLGVGLMASWVPARRASSVDPIRSLRGE